MSQRTTGNIVAWRIGSLAVGAMLIALWQVIAQLKLVSPVFLPSPERAASALMRGLSDGTLPPMIAGTLQHMADVLLEGCADAVLAASIFHFGEFSVAEVKKHLAARGIPVRL